VVSALIETGADVDGLCSALDLDAAFALFEPDAEVQAKADNDAGEDAQDLLENKPRRELLEEP
jgi:hypothetical protein